ncbi:MAG: lytic transglycosylase domain-containing protein [Lachnospiraceae bacterium]|nr:lytic transglycosylase domain-containing protein [Lachnospiraceae bacterium]
MQIKITEGNSVIVSEYLAKNGVQSAGNTVSTDNNAAVVEEKKDAPAGASFEDTLLDKLGETKDQHIKTSITYKEIFENAANKYGLDVKLLYAVAKTESNFDPTVTSSSGAMGLMQLMPETAKEMGVEDAYDPVQNVDGGAKLLSILINKYKDTDDPVGTALAAYNMGPGNVAKYGKEVGRKYIDKVLTYYGEGVTAPNKSYDILNSYTDDELLDALDQMLKDFPNHESFDEFTEKLAGILNEDKNSVYYSLTGASKNPGSSGDVDTHAGVTEEDNERAKLLFSSANKAIIKMLEERDSNVVQ